MWRRIIASPCLRIVGTRTAVTWHPESLEVIQRVISNHTELSSDHMTPSIRLHLITPNCRLWWSREEECPFPDPFWGFYWPGGQALTRYILENRHLFQGRRVVDVGCGCAASSIACAMSGATNVTANDIDKVALAAAKLNASVNGVNIETSSENLIGHIEDNWNTVILGDMFYDEDFANKVIDWLIDLHERNKTIFIGDPGRIFFMDNPLRNKFKRIAEYPLSQMSKSENNGMVSACVWRL